MIPRDIRAEVDFTVQSDWGSGFTGEAKITNLTDRPINSWEFEFELEISSFWNAELIHRHGNHYTVRSVEWNQSIPAGESVVFGFSASPGGRAQLSPSHLMLNGISLHVHTDQAGDSLWLEVIANRAPAGGPDQLKLRFPATMGRIYTIERSSDLVDWEDHESGILGEGGVLERNYLGRVTDACFFRVREDHT